MDLVVITLSVAICAAVIVPVVILPPSIVVVLVLIAYATPAGSTYPCEATADNVVNPASFVSSPVRVAPALVLE